MTDTPRDIRTQIEIDAPVEAVWEALTDAEALSNWFPLQARVKPGKGGSIWVSWGKPQEWETPIDAWEENRHLRLVYVEPTPEGEEPPPEMPIRIPFRVAVDYYLEARGGKTILRLVHSGFSSDPSWDNQYDGTVRGWDFELRGLKHYLEHHRGQKRTVIHARHPIGDLPLDDAWTAIMGPRGLQAEGDLTGTGPGGDYRVRTTWGQELNGQVHIVNPPRDLCATVENLNKAFLRLRIDDACFTAPGREVNLFVSTYGLPKAQTDELKRYAGTMLEALFSEARV